MRVLLEEAAPAIMEGLVRQVSQWAKPGKVEQNLVKLAQQLGAPEKGA